METTTGEFRKNLGDIKENVAAKLEKSAWNDRYAAVQAKAQEAVEVGEDFVKEHPLYTILGAATLGFVAGMLIRGGRK